MSFNITFYDEMYFNFFGRNLYNNVLGSGHKVGLPKRKKEFRVIRSPHVNKKSMEYFKLETSKELYSFFDSSLFKVFSILLTHVFYFFKFFELKSKLNFIMVLRVWKKISKINHKCYTYVNIEDGTLQRGMFRKESVLIIPFFSQVGFENSSFILLISFLLFSIIMLSLLKEKKLLLKRIIRKMYKNNFSYIGLGFPWFFKKKKERILGPNKPVDGENVNFRSTINPQTGIKESDALWTLRMYGAVEKDFKVDLPEGQYQEILEIEKQVNKLYAELSEEEKVEFDSYLHKEYFYQGYHRWDWTKFYNVETGALIHKDIVKHPVYLVQHLILSWKENTLNFYAEHKKFPWTDEVINSIAADRNSKLHHYLPEFTPPQRWFLQLINEFRYSNPIANAKYYFKVAYENTDYLSIEFNKSEGIGQNSLELLGTLWYNYRLFVDKSIYKMFLKPKDLGITVADFRE